MNSLFPSLVGSIQRIASLCLLFLLAFAGAPPAEAEGTTTLTVKYFNESGGDDLSGKAQATLLEEFYLKHPNIRLKPWSGLRLPGDMWMQADLLAFAAGVAADVQPLFFHQVQFYADQGLLAPLNQFVKPEQGEKWAYWENLPASFKRASTLKGNVVAIPMGCFSSALVYRKEVFEAAGLDPDKPPATLEEFWKACQMLTDPELKGPNGENAGRYALSADDVQTSFINFFFATGTQLLEVEWLDKKGNLAAKTRLEEPIPSGLDETEHTATYRASFDSPEAREALRWIHRFRWAPWIRDPATGQIRDLTEEEAGKTQGVIRGVTRPVFTQDDRDRATLMRRGKIAMIAITLGSRTPILEQTSLGICPFPPLKAGDPSPAPLLPMMIGLNATLKHDEKRLAAGWEWVKFRNGNEASRIENGLYSENGMGRIISVWELRQAGMKELLDLIPPQWRDAQNYIFAGQNIIPYINGWTAIQQELEKGVIEPMMRKSDFDTTAALTAVTATANEKVLGHVPPAIAKTRSGWSVVAFVFTLLAMSIGGYFVIKSQLRQARASSSMQSLRPGTNQSRILFYSIVLLGPSLLLLAVFSYYPVGRGLVMAFQDYRLTGESTFVGLQNFSEGLFASRFWLATWNTIIFVVINLALGFLMPFLLAVLVSELPIGTSWFRTIYYLPAVTAGLVVTLLWMRLYEPTETGLLNQFVEPFLKAWNATVPASWQSEWPVAWLQNPKWAMIAVIVPTIWASAGPGSLIYLAALKSIPEETYEAADLDGCGPWIKFRLITVPALFPLLLINFIGAFIGTFHGMGNIFVMTGGGPNFATHVLSLEIWQNAFLYLRFGVATAQAWVLAATLIGFVVLQLRILEKMDWRRTGP